MNGVPAAELIQAIFGIIVTFGFPVIGWFIKKIFSELEARRSNERELYKMVAALEIKMCKDVCEARELVLRELLLEARTAANTKVI